MHRSPLRPATLLAAVLLAGCSAMVDPGKLEPSAPAAPTGLAATAGNGQVTLAWSPVGGDVLFYEVFVGPTPDALAKRLEVLSPATGADVAFLTNGDTYWFAVTAVDSVGNASPRSAATSATPGGAVGIPPSVTATDPLAGATGVPTTAPIRITFSEPMDTASVEAAFSSSPTIACAWTWSSGNTVATCAHATALAPSTLQTLGLSMGAKDTTATPLATSWSVNFTTGAAPMNHGTVTIYASAPLDGMVWSSGQVFAALPYLYVGDNSQDFYGRAFVSFSLASVPSNATAITGATLGLFQEAAPSGDPYGALGALQVERVQYGTSLDASDLDLFADGSLYFPAPPGPGLGWKTVEVGPSATAAWVDRATNGGVVQFRLRFETNVAFPLIGDYAQFTSGDAASAEKPYLVIHYDYP